MQGGSVQVVFSQEKTPEQREERLREQADKKSKEVGPLRNIPPINNDRDPRTNSSGSGNSSDSGSTGGSGTSNNSKSSGNVTKNVLEDVAQVLSVFISILTFLSLLILDWGGTLIGTDMITGPEVMEAIRPMWVIVRNLTNIGFVIVLLFLAFANLFTFGQGNWTIKEKLPRIIMALIAINFSLLTFKVVIDAVHVGTISLLSISDTALQAREADGLTKLMEQRFDKNTYEKCAGTKEDGCLSFEETIAEMFCDKDTAGKFKEPLEENCLFTINPSYTEEGGGISITANNESARNLFLAFGVFFQHLERLPMLSAKLSNWTGVLDNVIFSGIMALAFMVALVCVFLALLVRVAILWIAMIFSPLIFAGSIMEFGDKASTATDMIFKALIMPLKIAGAFAVTFVMLTAMADVNFSGEAGNLVILGPALSQFGTNAYAILWQIMTVVIFWKVAFWALEDSPISGMIIEKIKAGAETAGGYIAKTATVDQTVIPVGAGGQKIGLSALSKFPELLGRSRDREMEKQGRTLELAMNGDTEAVAAQERLSGALETLERNKSSDIKTLIQFLTTHGLKTIREGGPKMAERIAAASSNIPGLNQEKLKSVLGTKNEVAVREVLTGLRGDSTKVMNVKEEGNTEKAGGNTVHLTMVGEDMFDLKIGEEEILKSQKITEENINELSTILEEKGVQPSDDSVAALMRQFAPNQYKYGDESPYKTFDEAFDAFKAKYKIGEVGTSATPPKKTSSSK